MLFRRDPGYYDDGPGGRGGEEWAAVMRDRGSTRQLTHPTGQLTHPTGQLTPPTGQLTHPTGQLTHPTGQLNHPTGQLTHPTGQLTHPTGQFTHPIGQLTHPTGKVAGAALFGLSQSRFLVRLRLLLLLYCKYFILKGP